MPNTHFVRTSLGAAALTVSALAVAATAARAQGTGRGAGAVALEIRPIGGALLPTGSQRDVLKDAASVGGQLGWRFQEHFALTGSFAWAPSRDRTTALVGIQIVPGGLHTGRAEKLDVFAYDLGVEARLPVNVAPSWVVAPYVGVGGGARTYDDRDIDRLGCETTPVGYGSFGMDIAPPAGPLGARIEVRDNVSAFKGLRGEYANACLSDGARGPRGACGRSAVRQARRDVEGRVWDQRDRRAPRRRSA